jgi:hypothetical protein
VKKLINTIDFYLSGKGSPRRLLFIWWFILNVISFSIGFAILYSHQEYFEGYGFDSKLVFADYLMITLGFINLVLGLIIAFIYPIILIACMWKSRNNTKNKIWYFFVCAIIIVPLQICLSFIYFFGSMMSVENPRIVVEQKYAPPLEDNWGEN